jgi:hypothetical protein
MPVTRSALMPTLTPALAFLSLPLAAQSVEGCDPVPHVTALIEPWEETSAALADGAVRMAVLEAEAGARALLVLTLPPPEPVAEGEEPDPAAAPAPPVARTCRLVLDSGPGFADIDLAALLAETDAAGTLVATVPALRFIAESSELAPVSLELTFGAADDSLSAAVIE